MSIANNIDYLYGVLSRIHVPLEQPSELEVMLMSTDRRCHRATKVSSKEGKGGLKSMPQVTISNSPFQRKKRKPFPTARGSLSLLFSFSFCIFYLFFEFLRHR